MQICALGASLYVSPSTGFVTFYITVVYFWLVCSSLNEYRQAYFALMHKPAKWLQLRIFTVTKPFYTLGFEHINLMLSKTNLQLTCRVWINRCLLVALYACHIKSCQCQQPLQYSVLLYNYHIWQTRAFEINSLKNSCLLCGSSTSAGYRKLFFYCLMVRFYWSTKLSTSLLSLVWVSQVHIPETFLFQIEVFLVSPGKNQPHLKKPVNKLFEFKNFNIVGNNNSHQQQISQPVTMKQI